MSFITQVFVDRADSQDRADAYIAPKVGACGRGWEGIKGSCRRSKTKGRQFAKAGVADAQRSARGMMSRGASNAATSSAKRFMGEVDQMSPADKEAEMRKAQGLRPKKIKTPKAAPAAEAPVMETTKYNGGSALATRSSGGGMVARAGQAGRMAGQAKKAAMNGWERAKMDIEATKKAAATGTARAKKDIATVQGFAKSTGKKANKAKANAAALLARFQK
jgi:hypothetical protein